MKVFLRIIFLTAIWVLLWGHLSPANVATGVIVSSLLLALYPMQDRPVRGSRVRPIALAHLLLYVAGQLVVSNLRVAREVVARQATIRTGIVACRLVSGSRRTATFVTNVLALSPGTIPVHMQTDPPLVYIHVLHLYDIDEVRGRVSRLEALTVRALGSPRELALLEAASRPAAAAVVEASPAVQEGERS